MNLNIFYQNKSIPHKGELFVWFGLCCYVCIDDRGNRERERLLIWFVLQGHLLLLIPIMDNREKEEEEQEEQEEEEDIRRRHQKKKKKKKKKKNLK